MIVLKRSVQIQLVPLYSSWEMRRIAARVMNHSDVTWREGSVSVFSQFEATVADECVRPRGFSCFCINIMHGRLIPHLRYDFVDILFSRSLGLDLLMTYGRPEIAQSTLRCLFIEHPMLWINRAECCEITCSCVSPSPFPGWGEEPRGPWPSEKMRQMHSALTCSEWLP